MKQTWITLASRSDSTTVLCQPIFLIWALTGLFSNLFIHRKALYNLNYCRRLVNLQAFPHPSGDFQLPELTQQWEGVHGWCAPLPPGFVQDRSDCHGFQYSMDTMYVDAHSWSSRLVWFTVLKAKVETHGQSQGYTRLFIL